MPANSRWDLIRVLKGYRLHVSVASATFIRVLYKNTDEM